jgi:hypothetical protein
MINKNVNCKNFSIKTLKYFISYIKILKMQKVHQDFFDILINEHSLYS